jgi:hypothetical protein
MERVGLSTPYKSSPRLRADDRSGDELLDFRILASQGSID